MELSSHFSYFNILLGNIHLHLVMVLLQRFEHLLLNVVLGLKR
jgi:hypothetical protein